MSSGSHPSQVKDATLGPRHERNEKIVVAEARNSRSAVVRHNAPNDGVPA